MLVACYIMPHGVELIPELADGTFERMAITRRSMVEIGRRCSAAEPDTVIVLTPHGLCIDGHVCVSVAGSARGTLGNETGVSITEEYQIDQEVAHALSHRVHEFGIPVAQAAYDADGSPAESMPMDWGVQVPLWFVGSQNAPQIVIVCPSRDIPRRQLIEIGQATAEVAAESPKRIAMVCSADQGHAHSADGPYGFNPMSSTHDKAYCRAVGDNDLGRLLYWRSDRIEAAMPDSFWQTLMLHGALLHTPMRHELLSYEAPTYYGMACAAYEP